MQFLAVDIGTSFIKGAVLDLEALRIRYVHRLRFPNPLPGLPPMLREFNPDEVVSAVDDLLGSLRPYAADCSGVVICTLLHGIVLTTEQGEPLSNLITWQDQRAQMPHPSGAGTYLDVIVDRLGWARIRELGNEKRPGEPACFLFWLAENRQLPRPDVTVTSLSDYVLSMLCNTPPAGIELTNAMAYGMLNVETLDWHWSAIKQLGLERIRWPRLRRQGEVVHHLRLNGESLPCYTPVGDAPTALVGTFLKEGELSLNVGTGSQVTMVRPQLELGEYQTRPFFDGHYLSTITHIPAGRALSALVGLLCELPQSSGGEVPDPWSYISRAAADVHETDLRVNLAFFASAYGARGEIANISEANLSVGHLFRAAFEHMADRYYASALRLSPTMAWKNLVFSGGLLHKFEVLRECINRRFRSPYRICSSSEDTLLGLMGLALAFSGRFDSVGQATAELERRYREEADGQVQPP